jgi:hypothetical protein
MSDFRPFLSEDDIKRAITRSKNYEAEGYANANALLIFSTSTQQTWLVASKSRLYCLLDDRRNPDSKVRWSMKLFEAAASNIRARNYKDRTGYIDIGRHTDWLYTKSLFRNQGGIVEAIRSLIDRASQQS